MMVSGQRVWTYDDYAVLPNDGQFFEVIEGDLYVVPKPDIQHQSVLGWLATLMYEPARAAGGEPFIGPLDVVLSPTNVVKPDVLFVAAADLDRITEANLQGAPTLAVEILSDSYHDCVRKRRLYEQFGVEEYWIVDPEGEQVEVAWPGPRVLMAGDSLTTDLLPGLEIDVAELLAAGR